MSIINEFLAQNIFMAAKLRANMAHKKNKKSLNF